MLPHKHQYHHSRMALSVSEASSSFNLTFFFLIITTLLLLRPCSTVAYADANDTRETPPSPPPPPPASDSVEKPSSAFKPGMAVVVGVLTTMFSLTFLLLLYIKHCNGATADASGTGGTAYQASRAAASFAGRKNSGIDRSIVESLPIFRFGSLRGQRDGLDCAVCLAKFESSEVLRLLPKCKHAFHVECVDTWLDAHSTCPLCRHRVDPEDILLVEDTKVAVPVRQNNENECSERSSFVLETRRVSGRHSSVGEKEGGYLEIILEKERERRNASSFRRSLDSATCATTSRSRNKKEGGVMSVGWLVRPRKDGMLLVTHEAEIEREKERRSTSTERRLEHQIIVSPTTGKQCGCGNGNGNGGGFQRWSDVQPSDLLYLTSEMIISSTSGGRNNNDNNSNNNNNNNNNNNSNSNFNNDGELGDSWVINTRSVSEITGLSRFVRSSIRRNREGEQQREREREEGVVSRWLAWISRTQTQPAVR